MDTKSELEKTNRKLLTWISIIVVALGLTFYIGWGLLYGSWNVFARENLGVYAVTIVSVGFGLLGIILNTKKLKELE